jgi:hypothetical protein
MPGAAPSKFWHVPALLAAGCYLVMAEGLSKRVIKLGKAQQQDLHQLRGCSQILFRAIPRRNREHIIGDLEEEYCTSEKRFSRLWYWGQVLALIGNYWWAALRRLAGLDAIRKLIRK